MTLPTDTNCIRRLPRTDILVRPDVFSFAYRRRMHFLAKNNDYLQFAYKGREYLPRYAWSLRMQ